MNVLFISPLCEAEMKHPPLGIGYMAAMLMKKNHSVRIIDMKASDMGFSQLVKLFKKNKFDLIGVTALTFTSKEANRVVELAKKHTSAKTVVGGAYVSIVKEKALEKNKFIDFGVYGEGEYTIMELVEALEDNKEPEGIKGLIYRKDGEIVVNPPRPPIDDLDALPFPPRELYELSRYSQMGVVTGRGCPFQCVYCTKAVHGSKWRHRSPENIIREIETLNKKYHPDMFYILDDTFTLDMKNAERFCDILLKKNLDVKWECSVGIRVDRVTPRLLKKMRRAGCERVNYGIESGNQRVLNMMKKGITLKQVEKAVKWAKDAGLIVGGFFMIGNPGDTFETVKDSVAFMKKLELNGGAYFGMLVPYPGTEIYDWISKNGRWLIKDVDKWSPHLTDKPQPIFETDDFPAEERVEAFGYAYRELLRFMRWQYIKHPSFIIHRLKQIRSLMGFKNFVLRAVGLRHVLKMDKGRTE